MQLKCLLATLLVACAPALATAQATTTKPAAKPAAKKPPAKPSGKPAPAPKKPTAEELKAIEEGVPLEEPDPRIKLTEADLAVAKKVYVGEIPCELGASVKIRPLKRDGFFLVQAKLNRFVMHPVESKTGAIRLEDPERGALWLQLGNKSMLMSQKLGQRLADECQSPDQKTMAEELKKNPINILEPAPEPKPEPAAAAPAAAASGPAGSASTPEAPKAAPN